MREANWADSEVEITALIGRVFNRVWADDFAVYFESGDGGPHAQLNHPQACCEDVRITEHDGDWSWLSGSPIIGAEHKQVDLAAPDDYGAHTANFYTISTERGTVHIRFDGESNGYYGTDVQVWLLEEDD